MSDQLYVSPLLSLSRVRLFVTPRTAACQASLSFTPLSLLKLMSIELVMPSNHLILYCPLLPSIFPSIRVFSSESALCIKEGAKVLELQHHSPSSEYSGLISFRIDRFNLLPAQETLKSLHQHHNLKHHFFSAQPPFWSTSHICT